MPHEIGKAVVGDVGIKLWRGGSGEPVLFLHGANGVSGWMPFFEVLASRFALTIPEHPSFGGSDDPRWIRNVPDLAMFYLDYLEQEGLSGVHLVGTSLGGWIAAEIAVRDRSRLKSLTLIAPAGIRVKGLTSGDNFIWSPEEQIRNLFCDQVMAERLLSIPLSDEQSDTMLKNRYAATKYGWQPRWFNPDLEKWLHRAKLPAHVLWGDSDKLLPTAYADLWVQRLPDARLTLIERCGHLPHIEKGEEVAGIVSRFIAGVAA